MALIDLIKERYSCRKFDATKPVSKEVLAKVLEAGRWAPTAKNLQCQRIYVIESASAFEKYEQCTRCRYGAPLALLVTYDKNFVFQYPESERESGSEDVSIVATHMMLAAQEAGLANIWINLFSPNKVKEVFNLPENEEPVLFLNLGYALPDSEPSPRHFERKELSEVVKVVD